MLATIRARKGTTMLSCTGSSGSGSPAIFTSAAGGNSSSGSNDDSGVCSSDQPSPDTPPEKFRPSSKPYPSSPKHSGLSSPSPSSSWFMGSVLHNVGCLLFMFLGLRISQEARAVLWSATTSRDPASPPDQHLSLAGGFNLAQVISTDGRQLHELGRSSSSGGGGGGDGSRGSSSGAVWGTLEDESALGVPGSCQWDIALHWHFPRDHADVVGGPVDGSVGVDLEEQGSAIGLVHSEKLFGSGGSSNISGSGGSSSSSSSSSSISISGIGNGSGVNGSRVRRHGIVIRPDPHPDPQQLVVTHSLLSLLQEVQRLQLLPLPLRRVIVVTTTHARTFQGLHMTGLVASLRAARCPLLWLVVEAGGRSEETAGFVARSRVQPAVHLAVEEGMPEEWAGRLWMEQRLRLEGLRFIRQHRLSGRVVFTDDSTVLTPSLFDEAQRVRVVGAAPVGILVQLAFAEQAAGIWQHEHERELHQQKQRRRKSRKSTVAAAAAATATDAGGSSHSGSSEEVKGTRGVGRVLTGLAMGAREVAAGGVGEKVGEYTASARPAGGAGGVEGGRRMAVQTPVCDDETGSVVGWHTVVHDPQSVQRSGGVPRYSAVVDEDEERRSFVWTGLVLNAEVLWGDEEETAAAEEEQGETNKENEEHGGRMGARGAGETGAVIGMGGISEGQGTGTGGSGSQGNHGESSGTEVLRRAHEPAFGKGWPGWVRKWSEWGEAAISEADSALALLKVAGKDGGSEPSLVGTGGEQQQQLHQDAGGLSAQDESGAARQSRPGDGMGTGAGAARRVPPDPLSLLVADERRVEPLGGCGAHVLAWWWRAEARADSKFYPGWNLDPPLDVVVRAKRTPWPDPKPPPPPLPPTHPPPPSGLDSARRDGGAAIADGNGGRSTSVVLRSRGGVKPSEKPSDGGVLKDARKRRAKGSKLSKLKKKWKATKGKKTRNKRGSDESVELDPGRRLWKRKQRGDEGRKDDDEETYT